MSSLCNLETNQDEEESLWLPPEVWADAFKFLSRRDLLRCVQPICRRFHAIAERKVDNVHVIRHFGRFMDILERNLPEANKQYQELAASEASLAEHIRLDEADIYVEERPLGDRPAHPQNVHLLLGFSMKTIAGMKRRRRAQMCVLRHSLELFRGCRLRLMLTSPPDTPGIRRMAKPGEFLAYLALLQPVRPFYIHVVHANSSPELEPDELLREPAMLSCPRLIFDQARPALSADSICSWLHYLPPMGEDEREQFDRTRSLYLTMRVMPSTFTEIIECCKKLLQQSESPSDRRIYQLKFHSDSQMPFRRLDHPPTGEVLLLQTLPRNDSYLNTYYHLRRYPIADLATADQAFSFSIPAKDGVEPPTVTIR